MSPDNVTVIEGDYTDAPDIEATWFIDPPYQYRGGRKYPQGSDAIDYTRLAEWCQTRRGQVIVCEAEPADWLPFRHLASLKNMKNSLTSELVWTNQPDNQQSLFDIKDGDGDEGQG